jgi:hypothetical protein
MKEACVAAMVVVLVENVEASARNFIQSRFQTPLGGDKAIILFPKLILTLQPNPVIIPRIPSHTK